MGIDAFLPGSQIDVRPVRDFDQYLGKMMDFRVVKVNHPSENVVVSHKVLVEEELSGQRKAIIESLEKGQILEGTVKAITDFGVFVDLGGVDGLVHITDLSWGRINHPSEIVKLDQTINVVVLDFDQEKKRISLGYKQLQPHPWENIQDKYPVGTKVTGKVVSLADYGSAVAAPQATLGGQSPYKDLAEVAPAYLFYLCRNHPFIDGNKRAALGAGIVSLRLNGIEPEPDSAAWEELTVAVAASVLDRSEATARLRKLLPK